MIFNKIINTLHPLERKVLPHIAKHATISALIDASKLSETEVIRAIQWLSNKNIVTIDVRPVELIGLDENGKAYSKIGLPEKRFLKAISAKPLSQQEIVKHENVTQEEIGVCIGLLKRYGAIEFKEEMKIAITDAGKALLTTVLPEEHLLERLAKESRNVSALTLAEKEAYERLKRRKEIIKTTPIKVRTVTLTALGEKLAKIKLDAKGIQDRLTPQMLKEGSWKGKTFRHYDVKINVPKITGGKRHFENQALEYIKRIWLDLGFKEMKGSYVQTSFWDLDTLFVPQDHPARQMQDTLYIGSGTIERGKLPPIYKKIKEVHEKGGNTGSMGWRTPWNEDEEKKLLLRTHTTVLSAQRLASLKKEELPGKFFNAGRVFRNEAVDWKHLFEFYQVDGIVVDENATLKHLKGYLRCFFGKMGYPDVRMRPAYFPYTEPSVEVDVFHPIKKEWVELGGAGIFRPEVVIPLLGKDVPVLAWGLGLARIVSGYYNITDIRDLYKNDLKQLREMKAWMRV
ncbi:phenylalanine--tRNA ligase subunit alpha [Candidatus Woesearchaeota archaeon]|nr:phenylalanine--tRNA ligase subunit alpha [Candidatus Woesearchaeota archaeon]